MLFTLFSRFSTEASIGLDFGSLYTRFSVISDSSGIHTGLNSVSKRETPNKVAFWTKHKPKSTISNISNIFKYDWAIGTRAFDVCSSNPHSCVPFNGSHLFTSLERNSIFLNEFIKSAKIGENLDNFNLVLAVSPTLSLRQRADLVNSATLANITISAMIDSTHASLLYFALERSSFFASEPKTIVIVDIGHTHITLTAAKFSKSNTTTIDQIISAYSPIGGGQTIDASILDKLGFSNQSDSKKSRLYKDLINARKQLTSTPKVTITGDHDIVLTNDILNESLSTTKSILSDLSKRIKSRVPEIDGVELIGGCSRIPALIQHVKDIYGDTKVGRHLNSENAVAFGAGYFAAELSHEFKVSKTEKRFILNRNITLNGIKLFQDTESIYSFYNITDIPSFKLGDGEEPFEEFEAENGTTIRLNRFLLPYAEGEVKYKTLGYERSSMEIEKSRQVLKKLADAQSERLKAEKTGYSYEKYLFSVREMLKKAHVNESVRTQVSNFVAEELKWLDSIADKNDFKLIEGKMEAAKGVIDGLIRLENGSFSMKILKHKIKKRAQKIMKLVKDADSSDGKFEEAAKKALEMAKDPNTSIEDLKQQKDELKIIQKRLEGKLPKYVPEHL